jgi:hypothetical protein
VPRRNAREMAKARRQALRPLSLNSAVEKTASER